MKLYLLFLWILPLVAQEPARVGTRDLVLKTFQEARPEPLKKTAAAQTTRSKPAASPQASIVGLTLWKMRPAHGSDQVKFRGLVHDADKPDDDAEWTAERASMEATLIPSEFLRLSIESARKGYLYVIDRDVYADGTMSEPSLVFPTRRLLGGDNRVEPGVPIEIPGADDKPPVFRVKKTRDDQVSVRLTLIVSSEPIREIDPKLNARQLRAEQVDAWEKKWGVSTQQFGNPAVIGKAYTPAEQAAAKHGVQPLGPNDPAPTVLIKSTASTAQPMLGSVTLKVQ